MPRSSANNTIARQWELLRCLPDKRPGLTTAHLAERLANAGFAVSKRPVERDLQALSTVFPIIANDKGMPWGWYWMEGASVDLPAISLSDALSLQLVEALLRPLLPAGVLSALESRFRQAKTKLDALANENPTASWPDKVRYIAPTLPLQPPVIDYAVLADLHHALMHDLQIDVCYRTPGDAGEKQLRLPPLGLVQRGSATYLVATAFQYSDHRIYALQRISELTVTDAKANRLDDFALDRYITQGAFEFGEGENIWLVARVKSWVADMLDETPLNDSQCLERNPDGDATISATIRDSWQLRWWLLSQGEGIVVEQPENLRQWMWETIVNMHRNYEEKK